MMSKYLCLAAIGSVSACPIQNAMKNMDKPLFGLLEKGKHCPASDAPRLNQIQAARELMKNVYTGYIKGVYQENKDVIDDTCFGEWMEPTWTAMDDLQTRIQDDFWSVSISEVKDVTVQAIDTFYKNVGACQFERVADDAKNWCMENPGQCFFMAGLDKRLYDDPFGMASSLFDMYKVYMKDDSCYTDEEMMAEIYRIFADAGEFTADVHGFDYKWDQSIEKKHIKKRSFEEWKNEAIKPFLEKNPWEVMFPEWFPMFQRWEAHMMKNMESFQKLFEPTTINVKPKPSSHHQPQKKPQPVHKTPAKKPEPVHRKPAKKPEPVPFHHKTSTSSQSTHLKNHQGHSQTHHNPGSFYGYARSWF